MARKVTVGMARSGVTLFALAVSLAGLPTTPADEAPAGSGATWQQWRGPARDGSVAGATWPDGLSAERLEQVWHVDLGPSYSGPIVTEKMVYVTETRDAKTEHVRALDRATGKQVWEATWEGAMTVPFFAASNGSWIRATPAYDPGEEGGPGRLYVAGMRDVLVCLDADTLFTPQTLGRLLTHFADPRVGAVAGNVNSAGVVLSAAVSINARVASIIQLKLGGRLYINTRRGTATDPVSPGVVLAPASVFVALTGSIDILNVFSLSVTARMQVGGGTFQRPAKAVGGGVLASAPLEAGDWGISLTGRMSFFGLAMVDVAGWVQSNGSFGLFAVANLRLGDWWVGVDASLEALICYQQPDDA